MNLRSGAAIKDRMDKAMKSSRETLRKRGWFEQTDLDKLQNKTYEELLHLVDCSDPIGRTSAIHLLGLNYSDKEEFISKVLRQLCSEKCLYTKIEICNALEKGKIDAARQMIGYLGKIGNNQHKKLPLVVSQKNSYPLPRDIIARTLGRMSVGVLPLMLEVLESDDDEKISEVLDAIGYMVFYNKKLGSLKNWMHIIGVMDRFPGNQVLIWKGLMCLSAFALDESIQRLEEVRYNDEESLLAKEARRSLKRIQKNPRRNF